MTQPSEVVFAAWLIAGRGSYVLVQPTGSGGGSKLRFFEVKRLFDSTPLLATKLALLGVGGPLVLLVIVNDTFNGDSNNDGPAATVTVRLPSDDPGEGEVGREVGEDGGLGALGAGEGGDGGRVFFLLRSLGNGGCFGFSGSSGGSYSSLDDLEA